MILVFSYNGDIGTTYVLKWLDYFSVPYNRINLEDEDLNNLSLFFSTDGTNLYLKLKNGVVIDFNNVSYCLYRGGEYNLKPANTTEDRVLDRYIIREQKSVGNFFYDFISTKCLGNLDVSIRPQSKLFHIYCAQKAGLNIPHTLVSSSVFAPFDFKNLGNQIITKSIDETIFDFSDENILYDLKTNRIDISDLEGQCFSLSLFQQSINVDCEIRSFYLDGLFYSIGMKRNALNQNTVDIRDCFGQLECFKLELPDYIKERLRRFMTLIKLNIGSFDIIKSTDDNYYFLEVNPTGQYDWVSYFGEFDIAQEIAKYLKNKHEGYVQTNSI
jgi:hypothetical protein